MSSDNPNKKILLSRLIKPAIGIVLSIIFLYLAFRTSDFQELKQAIRDMDYLKVCIGGLIALSTYYLRALQWYHLLVPIKRIPANRLISPIMIGFMGNCVLPARMGEFLRAYVIGKRENISKSSAFATIVVSRLFDGMSLLLFLWLILVFAAADFGNVDLSISGFELSIPLSVASILFFILYAFIIIFLILLYLWQEPVLKIVKKLIYFLPHRLQDGILRILNSFVEGLHILKDIKGIFFVTLYSLLIWFGFGISLYPLIDAAAFSVDFPFYTPFLLLAIMAFGVAIPAAPGFVGTYHYFFILGLTLAAPDVNESKAAALAIITHAIQLIPVIIIGVIFFLTEHLSLSQIREEESP